MSGSNPISESTVAQAVAAALAAISGATDLASLRSAKQATVGEQSEISKLNAQLKALEPEHKAAAGALIGKARAEINAAFSSKEEQFAAAEELAKLSAENVDMTAVAMRVPFGARHPLSLLQDQISDVFVGMGWEIAEGPELEHEWLPSPHQPLSCCRCCLFWESEPERPRHRPSRLRCARRTGLACLGPTSESLPTGRAVSLLRL